MSSRDENKNSFSEFSSFSDFLERKWINFKTRGKNFFKNMKKMRFFSFISSCIETIQVKVFKKGTLKNHILIKYLLKDLFLYFLEDTPRFSTMLENTMNVLVLPKC